MSAPFLAFDVSTCRHCGEPILRPATTHLDADRMLRWLHTPERVECRDWLTRESTGALAEPRRAVAA